MAGEKKEVNGKVRHVIDAGEIDRKKTMDEGFEELSGDLVKLEVGQALQGVYTSKAGFDTVNNKTGEVKTVNVYELRTVDGMARLLGVTQLDDAFSRIQPGCDVKVVRIADVKSASNRTVHAYKVYSRKPAAK